MVTYNELGLKGRLGNQLFQIAATIGIAHDNGTEAAFPEWAYAPFFEKPLPIYSGAPLPNRREDAYHYTPIKGDSINLQGWLQSQKYWRNCEAKVREQFKFKAALAQHVEGKMQLSGKPRIAVSIRRGDFVGNKNYVQLPARYYVTALLEHFPDFENYDILFFSDEPDYCRVHFECLPNAHFATGGAIEQLYLMSTCVGFVLSNSTFSWWGAWLSEQPGRKVVRPPKAMAGPLAAANDEKDYWPEEWQVHSPEGKIDMRDFTFTIPVHYDHDDRLKNANLSVAVLQHDLDTHFITGEQGSRAFAHLPNYVLFDYPEFHRTRMLNDMALIAKTPYVFNWDCDVFIPPMQLALTALALRAGAQMVYPYDGRFARMPRQDWFTYLMRSGDIGIVGSTPFKGKDIAPVHSVGGAVAVELEAFVDSGMENEGMVSYCPEDCERWDRWRTLGYRVERIKGPLYHMDHFIGINSSARNPHFRKGHKLLDAIRGMSPAQLRAHVNLWEWKKSALSLSHERHHRGNHAV